MLVITDLHLTDRERDEYRWDFFKWLKKQLRTREEDTLFILGDLTDEKDEHSARLVNRIVDTLLDLPAKIYVLKGNHDYEDEECPFFRFLGREELGDKLKFISDPVVITRMSPREPSIMMLPHSSNPYGTWNKLELDADVLCCHQTFDGADAGGYKLSSSISSSYFTSRGYQGLVLSGDIHVRQQCGDVLYVGCPYPIAFGDTFKPRILQVRKVQDEIDVVSVAVPTIRRMKLDLYDVDELREVPDLQSGDQIKVKMHLPRRDFPDWEQHRSRLLKMAEEMGVRVFSVELAEKKRRVRSSDGDEQPTKVAPSSNPSEVLKRFCESRKLDDALFDIGQQLIQKGKG